MRHIQMILVVAVTLSVCMTAFGQEHGRSEVRRPAKNGEGKSIPSDERDATVYFQPPVKRTLATVKEENAPAPAKAAGVASSGLARIEEALQELRNQNADLKKALDAQKALPTVGGQMFASYAYTTTGVDGNDYNRFEVERLYLHAKGKISDEVKFQLTTDIYRNSSSGTYYSGLSIRLKYAYFDYAPFSSLSLKVGVIPTIWPGFVDYIWKYRGVSPTVTDRNGYLPTADLGLSLSYALPEKTGDVSLFITNGNGYTSPESNRFKDYGLRASVSPSPNDPLLKKLLLAAYAHKGANATAASTSLRRDRFGGLVAYAYSLFSFGVEYDTRKDAPSNRDTVLTGSALSVFGEVKAPYDDWKEKLSVVWRHDRVDPNVDKTGDKTQFSIFGLAYKLTPNLTFVFNRQWTKAESETLKRVDGKKINRDSKWLLQTILSF